MEMAMKIVMITTITIIKISGRDSLISVDIVSWSHPSIVKIGDVTPHFSRTMVVSFIQREN